MEQVLQILGWMLAGIAGMLALVFVFLFMKYFNLWLRGFVTRAKIGPFNLVFMSLRKVNPQVIVDAKIMAVQAGLTDVSTQGLEAHFLAGGNVRRVIQSLIAAHRALMEINERNREMFRDVVASLEKNSPGG